MRKHIPNLLTISNLICGCLALFYSFHNNLIASACLIGIASIFDFMDGFVARMLNESSPIGKELDSLADLVSFGLVPGSVIFHLIDTSYLHTYSFIALAIPIFSAYRLAKFNTDERQNKYFIGLPTPANALIILSIPLITHLQPNSFISRFINIPEFLIFATIILSILLVSELQLLSFKFNTLRFNENKGQYYFIGISLIMIVLLKFSAIPILAIIYLLISILTIK